MKLLPRAVVEAPSGTGPAIFPLNIYRGDSYGWQVRLWSDTNQSQPVDLTGITVAAQLRAVPGGDPVVNLDCVVTLPNVIDLTLDATDSAVASPGGWDLQLTYPDGRVFTVLAGQVFVTADYTQ